MPEPNDRAGGPWMMVDEARRAEGLPDAPSVAEANEPIMQFFAYAHLPANLMVVSQPFGVLARHIVETLPRNPERTTALRKLLEAKDAAVRARLFV